MKNAPLPSLIVPPAVLASGRETEALHSLLRRIAAANQLTITSLVEALPLRVRHTWDAGATNLVDGGGTPSINLINALLMCGPFEGLRDLTLNSLRNIPGVATLACKRHRCWCPVCYEDDTKLGAGPYNRLLWSIKDVTVCNKHQVALETVCPWCNHGRFPFLREKDLSGYCPRCLNWLGGKGQRVYDDENTVFRLWCAQSFGDLLDARVRSDLNVKDNFPIALDLLAQKHFESIDAHLATAIGRNKSNIPGWKTGSIAPSWRALVDLSFASQTSLVGLISAPHDAVAASRMKPLPPDALPVPRKTRQSFDLDLAIALYGRVAEGEYATLRTITDVAKHLNTCSRELYRRLGPETKNLSQVLAIRRSKATRQRREAKKRILETEVPPVVQRLQNQKKKLTRRAVKRELAKSGVVVNRENDALMWQLVRETLAGAVTPSGIS